MLAADCLKTGLLTAARAKKGVLPADCVKKGVLPADCVKIDVLPADCAAMSMAIYTPAALPGLRKCHVDAVCLMVWHLSLSAA